MIQQDKLDPVPSLILIQKILESDVRVFQASLVVDMPLSRTRSLLANINTSSSVSDNSPAYSSHFSDTQVSREQQSSDQ